jgi:hypothetical protein
VSTEESDNQKTKDSRDEIHETHSNIHFIENISEEFNIDSVKKELAQYKQNWRSRDSSVV